MRAILLTGGRLSLLALLALRDYGLAMALILIYWDGFTLPIAELRMPPALLIDNSPLLYSK